MNVFMFYVITLCNLSYNKQNVIAQLASVSHVVFRFLPWFNFFMRHFEE